MKRSTAVLAGLLLAATLVQAAPHAPRTTPAHRPGLFRWLFGRRPVVVVHHAPRPAMRRHRYEARHDRGRHLGWTVGRHVGWTRRGRHARGPARPDRFPQDEEHRPGRGRGR